MIGVKKRIITFLDESGRASTYTVMLNSEIIKNIACTTLKKAVCRFLVIHVRVSIINLSRSSIRQWRCRFALRPTLTGRRKLFSMKLIIAMEF